MTVNKKPFIVSLILVSLFLQAGLFSGVGQEISDKELEQLKKQKEYAETRKAIAEAELAELKARFPEPKTTPLEGKTTISDGAVIESQMLSYVSMAAASNQIATEIQNRHGDLKVFAIHNPSDVNNLLSYRAAKNQVDLLKANYCEILDPTVSGGVCSSVGVMSVTGLASVAIPFKIAQSFLGGFVDALAMLRTNVDIKGQTFTVEDDALVSEVFRALRARYEPDPVLYHPAVYPPGIDVEADSPLLRRLEEIRRLKILTEHILNGLVETLDELKKVKADIKGTNKMISDLEAEITRLTDTRKGIKKQRPKLRAASERIEIAELTANIGALEKTLIDLKTKLAALTSSETDLTAKRDAYLAMLKGTFKSSSNTEEAITRLRAYNQQFDQFVASLVQVNQSGTNLITAYMRAENLDAKMNCRTCKSAWLQIKVLKAGGNNRIKTNLVIDIFRGGSRVSHSGGSIVQYNLFDGDGRSILSDTVTVYQDYVKSSAVKNLN